VGHGGEIRGDDAAVDVLAHGDGEAALGASENFRLEDIAEMDGFAIVIGDLDADGRFAGHAFDENAFGSHGEAEIVGQTSHARVLHAGLRLELVGSDHRSGVDLYNLAADIELGTFFDQNARLFAQQVFFDNQGSVAGIEQGAGRKLESAYGFGGHGSCSNLGIGTAMDGDWLGASRCRLGDSGGRLDRFRPRGLRLDWGRSGCGRWDCFQAHGPRPQDGHTGMRNRLLDGGALPDAWFACSCVGGILIFSGSHRGALEGWDVVNGVGVEVLLLNAVAAEEVGQAAGACYLSLLNFRRLLFTQCLGLSFALGALFTPVAPTIVPGDDVNPALLHALFESPEADSRCEVKPSGGEDARDQPCALNVHVADEEPGNNAAEHSFDRKRVKPVPMPGKESENGRQENKSKHGSRPAQPR